MRQRLVQAYKQAPWRLQTQSIGLVLIVLVIAIVIAALYLNVTAQAATAGLEIRDLEDTIETNTQDIANLETQLAQLTSSNVMEQRAKDLGFERYTSSQITYVIVPGYSGRQSDILIDNPVIADLPQPVLKPVYTQSLWDWLFQGLTQASDSSGVMGQ